MFINILVLRKFLCFICIFSIAASANAGNENFPIGARSASMGNASVSLSDVWSAQQNQAGLGFLKNIAAGAYYENRFSLKELSLKGAVIAVPFNGGAFGLSITNFGYSEFSENKYCFSFAKAFSDKFSMGLAIDYLTTKISEGYGTKGILAAEFGIQAKPIKDLTIGLHLFNPTRAKLTSYNNERIPTIIRLGADYNFSDKVTLAIETEKDIAQYSILKVGIEYKVVKEFYLRGGIVTNPLLSSFGCGLNLKNFKIDLSANYHQILGVSPQFSLTYQFGKKENNNPNKK